LHTSGHPPLAPRPPSREGTPNGAFLAATPGCGVGFSALSFSPLLLAQVAACGGLEGFLSVAIGIRRVEIDPDAHWVVNGLAGALRIVIAVIGSIFVYFAIASELILGNLSLENSTAGIFAISIAAGFSETFVPNVLQQVTQGGTPQK
jgi:hypothetical protein